MASIKIKFRPSTVADHEGTIYYQILHDRKQRQLFSDYHVFQVEWDDDPSMVTTTHKSERKSLILSIRERIRWDVERLNKIIRQLDNNGLSYTADDVIEEFNRYAKEYSLFNFMESLIIKLKHNGKTRTSETYAVTLNSFKKFRKGEDIMLDCINSEIMEAYEAWHQQEVYLPTLYHSILVFSVQHIIVRWKKKSLRIAILSVAYIREWIKLSSEHYRYKL